MRQRLGFHIRVSKVFIGDSSQDNKGYANISEILGFGIRFPPPIAIDFKLKGKHFRYFIQIIFIQIIFKVSTNAMKFE